MKGRSRSSVTDKILCDEQDEEFVRGCNWGLSNGYPARRRNGRLEYLHHHIVGMRDGLEVDHINHNKLDVRRENLRHVTGMMNSQNPKLSSANKSGHRGVCRCPRSGKWIVQVNIAGKHFFLGRFDNVEEAGKVASDFRKAHMPGATS